MNENVKEVEKEEKQEEKTKKENVIKNKCQDLSPLRQAHVGKDAEDLRPILHQNNIQKQYDTMEKYIPNLVQYTIKM